MIRSNPEERSGGIAERATALLPVPNGADGNVGQESGLSPAPVPSPAPLYMDQIRQFASAQYRPALWQLVNSLILYVMAIGSMFYVMPVSYGYVLPLAVVATIAHTRLFMIGHDCAHRSFLPGHWQNIVVGNFIGVLTNTPLRYWGMQHAAHHRTIGNLDRRGAGDVVTWTTDEYDAASGIERWWYRFNRNPWVLMFLLAPIHFLLLQRFPLEIKAPSPRIWRSVCGTTVGMAAYYGVLMMLFGVKAVLLVYLPVIWLSSSLAVWLFYVQHQFDTAYWARDDKWDYETASLEGSSFYNLPVWGHWITGNIGYHHIHHLNPRIPNYRLAECQANVDFQNIKTISFLESFRCTSLSLWDEDRSRMISFKTLRQLQRDQAATR
jgi:acyl-lipid omega-6 desaturase (Delta-12 desaturase)